MKKFVTLALGLCLPMLASFGQSIVYIIDNEVVNEDVFDGSQLKGLTITNWTVTKTGKGGKAVTFHNITTRNEEYPTTVVRYGGGRLYTKEDVGRALGDTLDKAGRVLYIIDGKKYYDASVFKSMSSSEIKSLTVLKEGVARNAFGEESVILVETKKTNDAEKERKRVEELLKSIGYSVDEKGEATVNGHPVRKITIDGKTYEPGKD